GDHKEPVLPQWRRPYDPEAPEGSPDRVEITRAARKGPVLDASLVLASQGVRHWIEFSPGPLPTSSDPYSSRTDLSLEHTGAADDGSAFLLTVDPADAARAREVLARHARENAGYRVEDPEVA